MNLERRIRDSCLKVEVHRGEMTRCRGLTLVRVVSRITEQIDNPGPVNPPTVSVKEDHHHFVALNRVRRIGSALSIQAATTVSPQSDQSHCAKALLHTYPPGRKRTRKREEESVIVDTGENRHPLCSRPRRCIVEKQRNLVTKVERKRERKEGEAEKEEEKERNREERTHVMSKRNTMILSRYGEHVARHTKHIEEFSATNLCYQESRCGEIREIDEQIETEDEKRKGIKRALLIEITLRQLFRGERTHDRHHALPRTTSRVPQTS